MLRAKGRGRTILPIDCLILPLMGNRGQAKVRLGAKASGLSKARTLLAEVEMAASLSVHVVERPGNKRSRISIWP